MNTVAVVPDARLRTRVTLTLLKFVPEVRGVKAVSSDVIENTIDAVLKGHLDDARDELARAVGREQATEATRHVILAMSRA